MPDLDQRIADGLRALVDRAPVQADVWPATEKYLAKHRRQRRAIAGAVVAVALVAGVLVTLGVLPGASSKVVVSGPSPTTEPQPAGPSGALTATGPIEGSFTITASRSGQLSFNPSAVTVTTGVYAIILLDGSTGAHTLDFDDPTTLWSELIVNDQGETKTSRIFFGRPGHYTFYDSIPGHRAAGMQGTVTVSGPPMTLAQAEARAGDNPFVGHWTVHGSQMDIRSNMTGVVRSNCGGQVCLETDRLSLVRSPDGTRLTATITAIGFHDDNGKQITNPNPGDSKAVGDSFSLQFVAPHLMKETVIRTSLPLVERGANGYWCGNGLEQSLQPLCGA